MTLGLVGGIFGRGVDYHVNKEGRAPLDEPGPVGVVYDVIIVEAIEAVAL
jgi:hypothetical protein